MNDCCVSNLITLEMDNYSVNPFLYWRKLFNCMKSQAEASFTGNLQFHLLCVLLEETIFDWLYFYLHLLIYWKWTLTIIVIHIMTLFSPVSPGSHYNGPLSRVDGEAVGDRPLILTFLNLHTKRETQKPSTKHHHHSIWTHLFAINHFSWGMKRGKQSERVWLVSQTDLPNSLYWSIYTECVCVEFMSRFIFSLPSVSKTKNTPIRLPHHHYVLLTFHHLRSPWFVLASFYS